MRSSYGTNFSLTLFGESHGPAVGFVLDGLPAGIELDLQNIRDALTRRRPAGKISTQRQEADEFRFLSGFYKGRTCGTPLTFVIENTAQRSEDYDEMQFLPRPSHADYAAFAKQTPGLRVMQAGAVAGYDPDRPMGAGRCVTVAVLPYSAGPRPLPDADFLAKVQAQLESIRPVCTRVKAVAPLYIRIHISVTVLTRAGAQDVEAGIRRAELAAMLDTPPELLPG